DAVLLESFGISQGLPEPVAALTARLSAAVDGRARYGTRIFGIATSGHRTGDAALAQYGWWVASMFGIDAYGWAEPGYSALTSWMPWVSRPAIEMPLQRASYIGEPQLGALWRRTTT